MRLLWSWWQSQVTNATHVHVRTVPNRIPVYRRLSQAQTVRSLMHYPRTAKSSSVAASAATGRFGIALMNGYAAAAASGHGARSRAWHAHASAAASTSVDERSFTGPDPAAAPVAARDHSSVYVHEYGYLCACS